jgi:hypothetical protein
LEVVAARGRRCKGSGGSSNAQRTSESGAGEEGKKGRGDRQRQLSECEAMTEWAMARTEEARQREALRRWKMRDTGEGDRGRRAWGKWLRLSLPKPAQPSRLNAV